MTRLDKSHLAVVVLVFLLGGLLGAQVESVMSDDDALEQFQKMKRAFVLISGKYMDPVEPEAVATGGVEGMLDELDPHSSYVPPQRAKWIRNRYEGTFGGVGIRYNILDDTARVISPLGEGPSEEAGIMAGDRIVRIEDSTAIGTSRTELQQRLTGQIGTEVTFTVYRPLSEKRLTFTIRRQEIPLHSVRAAYMMDKRTGYLGIDRFSESTHEEFQRKIADLKSNGMERLLLDLRQNNGGVMRAAIKIADEMLGTGGQTIVKTKGRVETLNRTWRSQDGGILVDEPVTVLIDANTASASEILAGTLQDHDRALLVGRRTFGKALVQKPFHLNDGSLLNLAVGRYYTPVGRLIQTPFDEGETGAYDRRKLSNIRKSVYHLEAYKERIPDSLTYRTEHGRTVFGGGGILPDYVVEPDTSSLSGFLKRTSAEPIFRVFAHEWVSTHEQTLRTTWQNRESEFLTSYTVSEDVVSEFWEHVQSKGILSLSRTSSHVDSSGHVYPRSDTAPAGSTVRSHLKGHIANALYGRGSGIAVLNQVDPVVQKARLLWPSSQELASYHGSTTESPREHD